MIDGLQLRCGPDLGRLAVEADDAVHRLHRRMREVWKFEIDLDDLRRVLKPSSTLPTDLATAPC